jgi:hypothetical protein
VHGEDMSLLQRGQRPMRCRPIQQRAAVRSDARLPPPGRPDAPAATSFQPDARRYSFAEAPDQHEHAHQCRDRQGAGYALLRDADIPAQRRSAAHSSLLFCGTFPRDAVTLTNASRKCAVRETQIVSPAAAEASAVQPTPVARAFAGPGRQPQERKYAASRNA